jgi:predicted Zn-dependent protease with MMP-like domain
MSGLAQDNSMFSTDNFVDLVAEALEALPPFFQERLNNVEVVVEDWPDRHTLRTMGIRSPYGLLGFYHGVPLTERTTHYGLVAPDKISIYRRPIEAQCRSLDELRATVHRVVLHELAHHFGIDDDRLEEIGAY